MKKGWVSLAIIIVLIGVIFFINQSDSSIQSEKPIEGFMAPDFTLSDVNGQQVTLSELRGKPVFINFWASWCPPCKEEMPYIQEAYTKYKDEVVFLGVNVTPGDSIEKATKFMDENGYDMPVIFDLDGEVSQLYRANSIPTSFFIDKEGVIQVRYTGPMSLQQIENYLNKIVED